MITEAMLILAVGIIALLSMYVHGQNIKLEKRVLELEEFKNALVEGAQKQISQQKNEYIYEVKKDEQNS